MSVVVGVVVGGIVIRPHASIRNNTVPEASQYSWKYRIDQLISIRICYKREGDVSIGAEGYSTATARTASRAMLGQRKYHLFFALTTSGLILATSIVNAG